MSKITHFHLPVVSAVGSDGVVVVVQADPFSSFFGCHGSFTSQALEQLVIEAQQHLVLGVMDIDVMSLAHQLDLLDPGTNFECQVCG
jgi:hypothetical protein